MFKRINKFKLALWVFMIAYIVYFSVLAVMRYKTLYSSYYDLGIMNQTVYNTFRALKTGDFSRFLEMTNTVGPEQIKRMAIHNDVLLAFLAPFYFIFAGPVTLLIIQTVILASGALAIFKIGQIVFSKIKEKELLSLVFSLAYLFYPPMQKANLFDFHAVTLSTGFLLWMFYFFLKNKFYLSSLFFFLSIFTKEQLPLTTGFFGAFVIYNGWKNKETKKIRFGIILAALSFIWFILSMSVIIPYFRGSKHFALEYYVDLKNPLNIFKYIFRTRTWQYLFFLLGPVSFLSLLSPIFLFIALPEFGINILSNSMNMTNIYYHYTSVITPFIFISAIYGTKFFWEKTKKIKLIVFLIVVFTSIFAYTKGPLFFSNEKEIHPFLYPQKEIADVEFWAKTLKDENLKISSTGQLSPFFTSRRYFYTFSKYYDLSDYIIVRINEIYDYPEKNELVPVYEQLVGDKRYELIYNKDNFKVFKKI